MTPNALNAPTDSIKALLGAGKYSEAEVLCRDALALLQQHEMDSDGWKETIAVRSDLRRLLVWSLRESGKSTEAFEVAESVIAEALNIGSKRDAAVGYRALAYVYKAVHDLPHAFEYFQRALSIGEEIGDKEQICRTLTAFGAMYCDVVADYEKALNHAAKALSLATELDVKEEAVASLEIIGVVYFQTKLYDKSLESYRAALATAEDIGDKVKAVSIIANIGSVHFFCEEYTPAMEFFMRSLAMAEELGDKTKIALGLGNVGEVYSLPYFDAYNPEEAEAYLRRAVALKEDLGVKPVDELKALAEMYRSQGLWERSDTTFRLYHQLEKESTNIEVKKKAEQLDQQRIRSEHEREIAIAKAKSEAEMSITTELLHKVLPSSIAIRLMKGERIADYFTSVSILFADIVGFTPIASKMPARKVLAFLNYVFGEFDRIIEKHGCEKIKTIGDGYMAVAGAPITCEDHAERIARAAIEMMGDIQLPEDIRESLPKGSKFNIRIGINSGPAFGGIVGENRFVYDIYSDAVNMAARMESHGEPGRIHVSEDFAFHLQNRMDALGTDLGGILLEERDEIEIKGKGMMKTYFLQSGK